MRLRKQREKESERERKKRIERRTEGENTENKLTE